MNSELARLTLYRMGDSEIATLAQPPRSILLDHVITFTHPKLNASVYSDSSPSHNVRIEIEIVAADALPSSRLSSWSVSGHHTPLIHSAVVLTRSSSWNGWMWSFRDGCTKMLYPQISLFSFLVILAQQS